MNRACDRIADGESQEDLMNVEWLRLETFKTFPVSVPVSTVRLSRVGFYYVGQSDEVKCFSCSIRHSGWKEGDIPSEIHKHLSPSCEFVRGTDGNNVPILEPNSYAPENGLLTGETIGATGGLTQNTEDQPTDFGDRLKFPEFKDVMIRLSSFLNSGVQEDIVNTSLVAEAGFFYTGFGDSVRCFYCGLGLRSWEYDDDPWIEHAKRFPWCSYLLEQKGKEFICEHSNPADTESLAFSDNVSSASVSGDLTSNKQSSGEISHENGQDKHEKSLDQRKGVTNGTCNGDDSGDQGLQNLQKECDELKKILMCKICLSCEKNVVFLPCSHMLCCQTCAPHVAKCPFCRKPIEGRKKIFLP